MKKSLIIALFASAFTGACTPSVVEKLPYYKMSVVQGAPLDSEAVLSLQTGMTREQVELILGAPLMRPSFRENMWTYHYQLVKGKRVKEQRDLNIYFTNNVVSKISGSALDYARQQIKQKGQ